MRTLLLSAGIALCSVGGLASGNEPGPGTSASRASESTASTARITTLDGLVVPGRIRARGIAGIVSVGGILSFRDGLLVWTTGEGEDAGLYALAERDGYVVFSAEHVIENGETVVWTGRSDGATVQGVTALWTRVEGDAVHDALLPDQVILEFTPNK